MVFSEGIADKVEKYKPAELNTLLEQFYAVIKSIQGEDFDPENLKGMVLSLGRHLKIKGYSMSIIHDREFIFYKQVLEREAKQLRLAGCVQTKLANSNNLAKDDSISVKVIRTQTEQFLPTFLRLKNVAKCNLG